MQPRTRIRDQVFLRQRRGDRSPNAVQRNPIISLRWCQPAVTFMDLLGRPLTPDNCPFSRSNQVEPLTSRSPNTERDRSATVFGIPLLLERVRDLPVISHVKERGLGERVVEDVVELANAERLSRHLTG